jgi:hypothetical protein
MLTVLTVEIIRCLQTTHQISNSCATEALVKGGGQFHSFFAYLYFVLCAICKKFVL